MMDGREAVRFCALADEVLSPEALEIVSASVYAPDQLSARIRNSLLEGAAAYGLYEQTHLRAVAITREVDGELCICQIAVAAGARGRGLGRQMLDHLVAHCRPVRIVAETDDDAVGFYAACGFEIQSLGELYPGVIRYRCVLRTPQG